MIRSIFFCILLFAPKFICAQVVKPITQIKFPEFSVSLLDYEVEPDEQKRLIQNTKPALHLSSIPGELPEGRKIIIKSTKAVIYKLEARYETGIFVTENGVTCDLSYWKTYLSPLKTIQKINNSNFVFPIYTNTEKQKFCEIDMIEFKQEVKSNCGDAFYNLIKTNTSVNQGSSETAICRYVLKISGKVLKTSKPFSKLIYFDIPVD
jgi:hypothetical protein